MRFCRNINQSLVNFLVDSAVPLKMPVFTTCLVR